MRRLRRPSLALPFLMVSIACGPSTAGDGSTTTTSAGGSSTGPDDPSAGDSTTGPSADSGSSTGIAGDPCLEAEYPDCPAGCMPVRVFSQGEESCLGPSAPPLCVGEGEALDPDERRTFYTTIDGELVVLPVGQPCAFEDPPMTPALWEECVGAPGEPPVCSCLCADDVCPYEAELLLLQDCGMASPCGDVVPYGGLDRDIDYATCVLTALRDRTPGAYGFYIVALNGEESYTVLDGSDQVQHLRRSQDDLCTGPLDDTWEPARTCTLQPPSVFDDCLTTPDMGEFDQCLRSHMWFSECTEAPAQCP